ncbi:hypothetical protein MTO96_004141 [Rhipicephalus appendiculatus]
MPAEEGRTKTRFRCTLSAAAQPSRTVRPRSDESAREEREKSSDSPLRYAPAACPSTGGEDFNLLPRHSLSSGGAVSSAVPRRGDGLCESASKRRKY